MKDQISLLKEAIAPVRQRLIVHPIYHHIRTPAALRVFMQFHVCAVWDFMSLLKALQRGLTCVRIPWVPVGSANTRYLINEIVTGEESDIDEEGRRISHFELYLDAMRHAGADTRPVLDLLTAVSGGIPVKEVIAGRVENEALQNFLSFTFDTIATGKLPAIAAVFTFGREDLIPDMFLQIVSDLDPGSFGLFRYYLERHIEVDGGHHGQLALAMVEELCGEDPLKWEEATHYAMAALESRIQLWDGALRAIGANLYPD